MSNDEPRIRVPAPQSFGENPYQDLATCACSLCRHTRTMTLGHARRELARCIRDFRSAGVTKVDDVYYILQEVWEET